MHPDNLADTDRVVVEVPCGRLTLAESWPPASLAWNRRHVDIWIEVTTSRSIRRQFPHQATNVDAPMTQIRKSDGTVWLRYR